MVEKDLLKLVNQLECASRSIFDVSEKIEGVTELTIRVHRGLVKQLIDIQHAVLCIDAVLRCALPSCEDCVNFSDCPSAQKDKNCEK